jgi:hypothetical protein
MLIDDWRDSWRKWSVQGTAFVGGAATFAAGYPDLLVQLSALMGGSVGVQALVLAVTVALIALGLINQGDEEVKPGGAGDGSDDEQAN